VRIFILGATGYIGGSVAVRLVADGHQVTGLVRADDRADRLRTFGIEPVRGALSDLSLIAEAARRAEVVISAANADDWMVAETLAGVLAGSGKTFIHTSGTSVLADRAAGEFSNAMFTEDTPFDPLPERKTRVEIDRLVLASARDGGRAVVIRPSLIYGLGRGLKADSVQIPRLMGLARAHRVARHVGRGFNVWSNVHIDDVVELYVAALAGAPPGASLFYAANGEASFKSMASAIGRTLGLGAETKAWPVEDALREWGTTAIISYGSNSRVSALKARTMLGWVPRGPSLFEELEKGCYYCEPS
jgi:nucleoside-diphosphate-sugar epimerase